MAGLVGLRRRVDLCRQGLRRSVFPIFVFTVKKGSRCLTAQVPDSVYSAVQSGQQHSTDHEEEHRSKSRR